MSDIKKLLQLMNETTVSGAIAPSASAVGNSVLKRPADTIFAAETVDPNADSGLEAAPKVESPANFGLWKNSAVIGKEQYGKHGRKKAKVDKTQIYPQLKEAVEPEQEVIDVTRKSRQSAERNAGLDEPDELPAMNNKVDFGTWHFTVNGEPLKKDGEVFYSSSKKRNDEVLAHLRKKAEEQGNSDIVIAVVPGAVKLAETQEVPNEMSEFPEDMADYTEDDWARWDAKVNRAFGKDKKGDEDQVVAEGNPGYDKHSFVGKIRRGIEADNKGWGQLGNLFAADNEKDAEKALRKGNRYYNMTRGSNKTSGGFPKTTLEGEQLDELSKDTLQSYKKKSETDYAKQRKRMSRAYYQDVDKYDDASIKSDARKTGIKAAKTRLAKKDVNEDGDFATDGEWAGTGDTDLAAATAFSGSEASHASIENATSLAEAEITEEMIADRLKNELALFKSGTKSKDKSIGKKPADREVQAKTKTPVKKDK